MLAWKGTIDLFVTIPEDFGVFFDFLGCFGSDFLRDLSILIATIFLARTNKMMEIPTLPTGEPLSG
jgi:hypothetical protein